MIVCIAIVIGMNRNNLMQSCGSTILLPCTPISGFAANGKKRLSASIDFDSDHRSIRN